MTTATRGRRSLASNGAAIAHPGRLRRFARARKRAVPPRRTGSAAAVLPRPGGGGRRLGDGRRRLWRRLGHGRRWRRCRRRRRWGTGCAAGGGRGSGARATACVAIGWRAPGAGSGGLASAVRRRGRRWRRRRSLFEHRWRRRQGDAHRLDRRRRVVRAAELRPQHRAAERTNQDSPRHQQQRRGGPLALARGSRFLVSPHQAPPAARRC